MWTGVPLLCTLLYSPEFIPQGATVDKILYKEIIGRLSNSIRRKRPELWHRKNGCCYTTTPLHIAPSFKVNPVSSIKVHLPQIHFNILTDSRITIDSLKNNHNHKYLIEEIRKKVLILEKVNWTTEFFWIKAHSGTYGNELADRLAKATAQNKDAAVCFDKIPKSIIQTEIEEEGKLKWQKEWDDTTKAAITKSYFPDVKVRLKMELNITAIFTSMVTGHGMTRANLH
ncbi:hypothetical protein ANN_11929 [Periplaneta americana]|uniref:RNase H type-1 domain-containing protein n=1 Tax=Periplaneta americana TaxID=6978 RepID=A0ABQ8T6F2_PERAM|nr:hypothetical protein ANN_11929 [Periplaneta americana]